jgi:dihydroorotate dehydrogenase
MLSHKLYSVIRPLLFQLSEETAHELTLKLLAHSPKRFFAPPVSAPFESMGLTFLNRVGLAAGLDKNGEYIDALAKLGFGFLEIGTVTPKAQAGNPKPRLFRLVKQKAIINRMGFNNLGVDNLIANVERANYKGILGINIGKNLSTPVTQAVDDYAHCFKKVYPHASYITVNVSSPNTPGLRELQQGELLQTLFGALKQHQQQLAEQHKKSVPMLAKLDPDLPEEQLKQTVQTLVEIGVDGFIFSNTTQSREGVETSKFSKEAGGLSGAPLQKRATDKLKIIRNITNQPIIGVGGICDVDSAKLKFDRGADLIQLYSGLIYGSPSLVHDCASLLSS